MSFLVRRHGDGGGTHINGHYVPTMDEMMEYQATREPWDSSVKYGRYTVYFCAVSLAVFFLVHWIKVLILWTRLNGGAPVFPSKLTALLRLLTYPRLPYPIAKIVNYVWTIGPLGPNILLFIALLYTSLYCWVNEYYYRPPFYGSPPLALRSEWIATALVPFVFVLGAKRNLISWIIGVSHDKLQVFHQGVAFIIVYFSMVHAISEIVQSKMELPWTQVYGSDPIWWTGFAALGSLIWLYLGSLPIVRKRLYECFYVLHIAASILFVAFLYKHGFGLLDTDAYMKATLILFGFGFLARFLYMVVINVFFRHRAQLSLQSGLVRIAIPTNLNWSPGMHIFIRFVHVRPFESHPFTLSSLPVPKGEGRKQNEMTLLIKPETGFTRLLSAVAATATPGREFPVILDGPYGEGGMNSLRAFDSVLLLAGGTGISFILPLLSDLARSMKDKDSLCKVVELVWAVKDIGLVKSFESQLLEAKQVASSAGGAINVQIYTTGTSPGDEELNLDGRSSEKNVEEEEGDSISREFTSTAHTGRPNIPSIVISKSKMWTGHAAVAVCGPLSLMTDASNAVSRVQLDILSGRATCKEMHLRSETFGW
ncbi:hypothetical protein FS842_010248 [Serendipita sp. 407]|nr:hypothetical protein FS842_010248 [Serendipita sp. 407]